MCFFVVVIVVKSFLRITSEFVLSVVKFINILKLRHTTNMTGKIFMEFDSVLT